MARVCSFETYWAMKVLDFAYIHIYTYLLSLTGVLKDLKRDHFCKNTGH